MKVRVDLAEMRQLEQAVAQIDPKTRRRLRAAVKKEGKETAEDASRRAPRLTGELASKVSSNARGLKGQVSARAVPATFQEWGTAKMRPQPYMGPAAEAAQSRLEQKVLEIGEMILDD